MEDSVLTATGGHDRRAGTVESVTAAVALHVRALRLARGWSLDELSGRSGVSKGMVVQIEAARTNPSVGTLCRIADAFGVTIARLLELAGTAKVRVTAADDSPLLWRGEHGGFGRLLGGVNEPDFVELWEWRLEPGDRHGSADHAPGTRELLHVLTGRLSVTVDGIDHLVRAGETVDFMADTAHGYGNGGDETVRLLMVVIMPPGDFDRRR